MSFDPSRELGSEDRAPRPIEPGEESHEEGLGRTVGTVRAIYRRRVDFYQKLVVLDDRRGNLGCADNVGGT